LLLGQSKDLRQDVEADDAEQNAGGEGENEMQPGAEPERKQPPGDGSAESSQGEQDPVIGLVGNHS